MEAEERPAKIRKLSHDNVEVPKLAVASSGAPSGAQDVNHLTAVTSEISGSDNNGGEVLDVDDRNGSQPEQTTNSPDFPPPDDVAPLASSDLLGEGGQPMSKNQLKKLRKKQEWEAKRPERKAVRKEKLMAKRERKREAYREQQAATDEETGAPVKHASVKSPPKKAVQLPVTILIDCDFDDLMRDHERISLGSQLTRCYSDNKSSLFRAHLTICSFNGKLRERFDNVLGHYKGWRGVRFLESDFVEAAEQAKGWMNDEKYGGSLAGIFSKYAEQETSLATLQEQGEIVYLSSEASETLTELKPFSTYIVGGLVDKNREKGICYKRATERGIRTAKLPIGDYLQMSSRKVLATNHVNEIMIKWLESGDWSDAFMKVIPKRKGGKLIGGGDDGGDDGGEEEDGNGEREDVGDIAADAAGTVDDSSVGAGSLANHDQ
ncbi:hypothetical protein LTR62_002599 [Meristemomyces frigidus]|uniref:tRNA (guanine(9)-N1)-methyltransferase n=1 Tax=Meristemomyces frigidus TaxID=1508187 RepID=A0AAN7TR74_9PEZI|nr:hypothetical protein LTR62_002599 [Meristemomyces frigidus]